MFDQLPTPVGRSLGNVAREVLLVVDVSTGLLAYVSAGASEFFALDDHVLAGATAQQLVPELASLSPRDFQTRLETPYGSRSVSVVVQALHGQRGRFSGTPVACVSLRMVDGEAAPLIARAARVESLWQLVVRRGVNGTEYVRSILREATSGIGLERADLERVEGDELVNEASTSSTERGERVAIGRTVAGAAVLGSGTFAVFDTRSAAIAADVGDVRALLAAAFRVGEDRYVLTFTSSEPRQGPFSDDDWRYVETVVESLSRGIERRESDDRIERLAYVDALTQLPNRVALHARLDEALAESERIGARTAVLFLDIDGFKSVNDTMGHRGGDAVLAEVAQRLRGTLRRGEFIGRLGGDEFAIVVPFVEDRTQLQSLAHRIGGVLAFPFGVDAYRFSLGASIGIAISPDDATTRDDLLGIADAAMYAAKGDGGSRVRFGGRVAEPGATPLPSQPAPATTTSTFAGETRDVGYVLCYQPILDVATGTVAAAEALIRRIDPVHGLLAPERGWSLAQDEIGRQALDRWVLREAASQARAWERAGTSIRIDVNLAAFNRSDFDESFAGDPHARDVGRLRVELSAELFEDPERRSEIAEFIEHGASRGLTFALDGFDGNLATLASLAHLPIDAVKLDRSIVDKVRESAPGRAIVAGTLVMAKSMGWSVIAKGVETATQQDALVSIGCDGIQGFFVARPMTAMEFGAWVHERRSVGQLP